MSKAALLRTKRDLLKPEVIWNIEEGLKLTVDELERAEAQRVALTARTLEFFDTYDLLLAPATIVAPFRSRTATSPNARQEVRQLRRMARRSSTRSRWCAARRCRCPAALRVGLPVGLQMVAPPRGEAQLLAGAKVLEDILGVRGTTPDRSGVDQDKCQGHARCKSLAPELFELDEFGNAHEVGDGTVPAGLKTRPGSPRPIVRKSRSK
jgi:amidase